MKILFVQQAQTQRNYKITIKLKSKLRKLFILQVLLFAHVFCVTFKFQPLAFHKKPNRLFPFLVWTFRLYLMDTYTNCQQTFDYHNKVSLKCNLLSKLYLFSWAQVFFADLAKTSPLINCCHFNLRLRLCVCVCVQTS